jgi:hypothetical protein
MKYATKQLVRPQHEHGCDYGHGRRSVLIQNGKKQILHIASAKHWGGIGAGRYSSKSEIAAYPVENGVCKQQTLAEGRMNKKRWQEIAVKIYEHLGMGFDLNLISLQHTLLLDQEGEVESPPELPTKPKKVHPRIESDRFFRVFMDEDGKTKLVEFPIVKQGGGKIAYRLPNGREVDKSTKQLIEDGAGSTADEAVAVYLRDFEGRVTNAMERLCRAADSYSYHNDSLTEAKNRIEAMLKETK